MYKKKSFFITFEGIEGSGKSFQSRRLYKILREKKIPCILTREPGGTKGAEKIRNIILEDYFDSKTHQQFNKYTDTLLYLAARNEHIISKLKSALLNSKKQIVICDRFMDSTTAYQVYGKGVNKNFVDLIHKHILRNIEPDLTFILTTKISKAMQRLKKRKKKNRYDKFSKNFYIKVQRAFINIAKSYKKRCFLVDNSKDTKETEETIIKKVLELIN